MKRQLHRVQHGLRQSSLKSTHTVGPPTCRMNYFAIKQAYYTGDFAQTLQEIAKFNKVSDDTLLFYKHSASLKIGQFAQNEGSSNLDKAFSAYKTFLETRDLSKLQDVISIDNGSPFELHVLASAQGVLGDFDESLQTCVVGIDNDESEGTPELLLLAVEIALLSNQASAAATMLENYNSANEDHITGEDELILNLAESYVKYATNQETTRSNFYYFEELAQTFPTWKTQLGILNLHLQQGNIPEARSIVEVLESDYYSEEQKSLAEVYKPHFLASKLTLSILENNHETEQLRAELASLDPESAFNKQHKEVEARFDEISAKYSS